MTCQEIARAHVGLRRDFCLGVRLESRKPFGYQAQKDCAKSIATYEEAAGLAELGSDEQSKTIDLTRAWRGEGYCLVEQGKLDLAEAMYKKSIALDPHDDKSRGELNYIRGLRK